MSNRNKIGSSGSGETKAVLDRRDFLVAVSASACAAAAAQAAKGRAVPPSARPFAGQVCFFSKPLPELSPQRLGKSIKRLGFDGIDLTVRKGGHVLPEKAAEDLPRAVRSIRDEGLEVPMITTELVSATDPAARPILSAAAKLSIPFFKPGYYKYQFVDVREELVRAGKEFSGLAKLGQEYGIQVGFHNHEGNIGAALWDIATVMDNLDPKWSGYYFDIRHATAEGGVAGWKIATNLVAPRLKMIAVKDFYWENWEKSAPTGGWREVNCPLGQGMVKWQYYFRALAQAGFHGPLSVHLEYQTPGATAAAREDNTLAAAERDLTFVRARLAEAYGTSSRLKERSMTHGSPLARS